MHNLSLPSVIRQPRYLSAIILIIVGLILTLIGFFKPWVTMTFPDNPAGTNTLSPEKVIGAAFLPGKRGGERSRAQFTEPAADFALLRRRAARIRHLERFVGNGRLLERCTVYIYVLSNALGRLCRLCHGIDCGQNSLGMTCS